MGEEGGRERKEGMGDERVARGIDFSFAEQDKRISLSPSSHLSILSSPHAGETASNAVITVPAYFNDAQRQVLLSVVIILSV